MASIKDTAATSALNEEQYINKLYDTNMGNQKQVLQENYDANKGLLDAAQEGTQKQTAQFVNRTEVEGQKAASQYGSGGVSAGAQAQVDLTRENARRRNVNTLQETQNSADMEYQRRRQLMARQFETEIRQAQAENNMQKAQALLEAARKEDAKLLELQKQGAALMAEKGDNSILNQIAKGVTRSRDTKGDSWDAVLKNEDAVNQIYDSQLESLLAQLNMEYEQEASDLEAERQQQAQQTDEKLNQAYVESLRGQKNQNEMSNAYGRSSGAAAQGRLSGDVELQDTLTDIRRQQLDKDAQAGLKGIELGMNRGQKAWETQSDVDRKRAEALFDAAENEEQILIGNQQFVGQEKARQGNYEMLGKLYGLSGDQVDRLMNRGKYAPVYYEDSGSGYRKPKEDEDVKPFYEELYRPNNVASEKNMLLAMKRNK